jgi:hypothetical protein
MPAPSIPTSPGLHTALIACGALAREVLALRDRYGWTADVLGVPVLLHNRPDRIAPAVRRRIQEARQAYDRIVVIYGECGTRGELDAVLAEEGVERVAGPHCYEMYADGQFADILRQAPGTFFLTDYLVRSFDHLVIENLGIDRHPELKHDYFGHYTRLVYLAQTEDPELAARARQASQALDLPLEIRHVGLGGLEQRLVEIMQR